MRNSIGFFIVNFLGDIASMISAKEGKIDFFKSDDI